MTTFHEELVDIIDRHISAAIANANDPDDLLDKITDAANNIAVEIKEAIHQRFEP